MQTCPVCGGEASYIGFTEIECNNMECKHFVSKVTNCVMHKCTSSDDITEYARQATLNVLYDLNKCQSYTDLSFISVQNITGSIQSQIIRFVYNKLWKTFGSTAVQIIMVLNTNNLKNGTWAVQVSAFNVTVGMSSNVVEKVTYRLTITRDNNIPVHEMNYDLPENLIGD